MEEIDTILAYKDSLKIIQEKNSFSFSIDSTILSFFVDIKKKTNNIIDLGCGNGVIPLFLSMFTDKKIYGIEIQKYSFSRALRSVELNNLSNQITILNDDIKGISNKLGKDSFGLVVSNPPYFKTNDSSFKNDEECLSIARHELLITFEEIIKEANLLLKEGGSFSFIQRTDRFLETIDLLKKYHFSIKRLRFVYPKCGKESYVFMMDATKRGKEDGLKVLEPLYIYDGSDYSTEVLSYFHYGEKDEKNK